MLVPSKWGFSMNLASIIILWSVGFGNVGRF